MGKIQYVLFDGAERDALLPFTFTRAVAEIRIGILKIYEKWQLHLESDCAILSQAYLQDKYSFSSTDEAIFINASFLPNTALTAHIRNLRSGQMLLSNHQELIAFRGDTPSSLAELDKIIQSLQSVNYDKPTINLKHTWDIFTYNAFQIQEDIRLKKWQPNGHILEKDNKVSHPENIYVEEGAKVFWAMLNAEKGPIYIGKDSEIMEGAIIKGNFALLEHAQVKMSAKMYGDSTVGPHSKVGGEISNSVIFGYSNKGHDGFLGNSVLGEWCNLGADTNNSNLKNNYSKVHVWDYQSQAQVNTGLQFCGLIMGDHSKCGINTMFNTGTVVGVSANLFGGGFPPKFIPSFTWGGADGMNIYDFEKALITAENMMKRRDVPLTGTDIKILKEVFDQTSNYRK